MNFKVKDLGSEINLNIERCVCEIISTELNQLKLKVFNRNDFLHKLSGSKEYELQNSTLQIGKEEIFLYGWIMYKDKSFRIKYALNIEKE